jgi:hypothetical protein
MAPARKNSGTFAACNANFVSFIPFPTLRQLVAVWGARRGCGILRSVSAPNRSILVDVAIIIALALVAAIGYLYSPLLLPKADLTLAPAAGCDLHRQACSAEVPGGGRIELTIAPHPIPVFRPMQVGVVLSGLTARKVEIDFAGITMNMGFNRVALDQTENGHYAGEATIPVCVTGRMAWKATLMVETDHQRIAVPFLFEAPLDGT